MVQIVLPAHLQQKLRTGSGRPPWVHLSSFRSLPYCAFPPSHAHLGQLLLSNQVANAGYRYRRRT